MIAFIVATLEGPAATPANTEARPAAILIVSLLIMLLAGFLSAFAKRKENDLFLTSLITRETRTIEREGRNPDAKGPIGGDSDEEPPDETPSYSEV